MDKETLLKAVEIDNYDLTQDSDGMSINHSDILYNLMYKRYQTDEAEKLF